MRGQRGRGLRLRRLIRIPSRNRLLHRSLCKVLRVDSREAEAGSIPSRLKPRKILKNEGMCRSRTRAEASRTSEDIEGARERANDDRETARETELAK